MRAYSLFSLTGLGIIMIGLGVRAAQVRPAAAIDPTTMRRIATLDARFQSYNVEMAEVIGGDFWKPYDQQAASAPVKPPAQSTSAGGQSQPAGLDPSLFQARPPIDLTNARLRKLATAIGPAYMRTSGTWANMVYFHDSDSPPPKSAPKGFKGVLTRAQWKGVVDFARAVNSQLVSSFTVSQGVRDASAVWTPDQASRFVAYTKTAGGDIAAAEFFNEPDLPSYGGAPPGYTAADYARDFAVFRTFAKVAASRMQIVGPGSVGEGTLMMQGAGLAAGLVPTEAILSANPRPVFDVFSYHHYGAVSRRCAAMGSGAQTTAADALSEEWLARTDASYTFYGGLRDRFEPGMPIWITETAESACGGNPWAAEFLDTFRYLDQLGRLAKRGVNVVFHNTLASSEYGLLDQNTFMPRPNYWAALLWRRLMGPTVLDAGASQPNLHLYAQCLPGRPGGVTLLAMNTSRTREQSIDVPKPVEQYTLSAATLEATEVHLNGRALKLQAGDTPPDFQPERLAAGAVKLLPTTITFLAVADAGNNSCSAR
jgi:heparanase